MTEMGCSASVSASISGSTVSTIPSLPEKMFGKVSILNGDCSIIATGTIVPVGVRTQLFGRIHMTPALKIKSDEDGNTYDQDAWITKYNGQVKRKSVYASDPASAKAYAENVQKMNDAANATTPRTPRTPRTPHSIVAPLRRTNFGIPQPPLSATLELSGPMPFNFDLPSLPSTITPHPLI